MSLLHDYELDASPPSNDSAFADEMNNGAKIECKNDERDLILQGLYMAQ